jgi:hypothetical protein
MGEKSAGARSRAVRSKKRKLWPALAGVLAVAAVLLGIALGTGGSDGSPPALPPAVQPVGRGADVQEQARNLSAWLRRYSR